MLTFKMDFNLCNRNEEMLYTIEQLKEWYLQSKADNAAARSLLMAKGSNFVEAIILELQYLNKPEKHTFPALYQIGMTGLARIIDNESFDHYRSFAVWRMRQKIKNALIDER